MSIVGIGDTVADGGGGGFAEFTQRFSDVAAAAISSLPAAAAVAALSFFPSFLLASSLRLKTAYACKSREERERGRQ